MPAQFETIARVGAGESRFLGGTSGTPATGGSIVKITDAPVWNSVGTAAQYQALFNAPSPADNPGLTRYITDADVRIDDVGAKATFAGGTPSSADGYPVDREESLKHMGDTIRTAQYFLPTGAVMYVRLWWGSL